MQLVEFHRRFFTRIYPSGQRVNSSNYDPMVALSVGVQQ
jgi:phosphatidylinositol phospholipase C delta